MKIEIIKGFEQPQFREYKDKEGNIQRSYYQEAYAHTGGAFPVRFRLPLPDDKTAYSIGEYFIDPSSFVVNQYDGLEVSRYNLKLKPAVSSLSKAS